MLERFKLKRKATRPKQGHELGTLVTKHVQNVVYGSDHNKSDAYTSAVSVDQNVLQEMISSNSNRSEVLLPQRKEMTYQQVIDILQEFVSENVGRKNQKSEYMTDQVQKVARSLDAIITEEGTLREKMFVSYNNNFHKDSKSGKRIEPGDTTKKSFFSNQTNVFHYPVIGEVFGEEEFRATSVDGVVYLTYYDEPGKQPNFALAVPIDEDPMTSDHAIAVHRGNEYKLRNSNILYARALQRGVKFFLDVHTRMQEDKANRSQKIQPMSA
jgi:hypothetical protein